MANILSVIHQLALFQKVSQIECGITSSNMISISLLHKIVIDWHRRNSAFKEDIIIAIFSGLFLSSFIFFFRSDIYIYIIYIYDTNYAPDVQKGNGYLVVSEMSEQIEILGEMIIYLLAMKLFSSVLSMVTSTAPFIMHFLRAVSQDA